MDIIYAAFLYIQLHWLQLLVDAIAIDHAILIASQKDGVPQVTSICQKIAGLLNFIWDVGTGIVSAGISFAADNKTKRDTLIAQAKSPVVVDAKS